MRWLDPLMPVPVDHAARMAEAETAAARQPEQPDRYCALGDACLAARAFARARTAYHRALELDAAGFDRWRQLVEACYFGQNPVEALAVCERGLRGAAADGRLHLLRGMALRKLGFADKAVPDFERALALGPNAHAPLKALLRPLSENGDPAALLDFCERLAPWHHRNALVIGYRAVALSQLGRVEEACALVDLDRHVVWRPLDLPPGYPSIAAFNAALAEEILADPPVEIPEPSVAINYAVRIGPALAALRGRVREAIEAYLAHFDAMGLGSALPAPPPAATMRIGTTVIYDDGSNRQHVHPTGYVSTVYYVRIPESVRTANDDRGSLQLGACDQRAQGHAACWGERRIKPVEGWIAIFPSHVFHDVIPPLTAEPRISVPMDMEPVWDGVTAGAAADAEDSVG